MAVNGTTNDAHRILSAQPTGVSSAAPESEVAPKTSGPVMWRAAVTADAGIQRASVNVREDILALLVERGFEAKPGDTGETVAGRAAAFIADGNLRSHPLYLLVPSMEQHLGREIHTEQKWAARGAAWNAFIGKLAASNWGPLKPYVNTDMPKVSSRAACNGQALACLAAVAAKIITGQPVPAGAHNAIAENLIRSELTDNGVTI